MDVVHSLKALATSTMTPKWHSGLPIPQFFKIWPLTPQVLQYKGSTHMPIHSISKCYNSLYTYNMDVVYSLKPLAASTMTPQRHLGSAIPQFFKIWPQPLTGITV
jgi:hypothetical protein